jgi:PAS domain S-box-containing protein
MTKANCWEVKGCGREIGGLRAHGLGICPAATAVSFNRTNGGRNGGRVCWAVAGALCGSHAEGTVATKESACCIDCGFFKRVQLEEGASFSVTGDIEERNRLERERDRFFALSLDGLCVAGLDGYFKRVNPAFQMLGYSEAELRARPFLEFVHPDDRAATVAAMRELATGESISRFENRYVCKDGSSRWLSWTTVPEGDTLFGIARDVTDRKRAEQERLELLEKEHAARTKAEEESSINEMLSRLGRSFAQELDRQRLVQLITDEAKAVTGAQLGAFFFKDDGTGCQLYTLSGASREAFAGLPMPRPTDLFGPTFRGEGPVRVSDVAADPRYGRLAPHHGLPPGHLPVRSYLAVAVVDRKGTVAGALFLGHAEPGRFTERHERTVVGLAAQATIALENARLYEQLKASEQQAQRAVEAATEADRHKDEFLALLGHELRNPLAPIVTALELMRMQGDTGGRQQVIIERHLRKVVQLVDDLLDISRLTRGAIELKRRPIEMAEMTAEAVEQASPLIEERSHQMLVDVPLGLVVDGDELRLTQVIANLLTNAAKYSAPGRRIFVRAGRDGDTIWLRVRDEGMGIPPQLLPRMFDLFVQGERSLDRAEGGLGIGLSLVRSLMELHGGRVTAHSDGPGRGSEFVISLPCSRSAQIDFDEGPAPAAAASTPGGLAQAGSKRVLIVDDNADAAELLAEVLQSRGHATRVAYDAPTALTVASEFAPEVALLDIGLPEIDGYELARRIRGEPWSGGLRLIALTGYGQSSDRKRSSEAGFDDHLVKPVDIDVILDAVARRGGGRAA